MVLASGARFAGHLRHGKMQWPAGKGSAVVVVGEGEREKAVMVVAYLVPPLYI